MRSYWKKQKIALTSSLLLDEWFATVLLVLMIFTTSDVLLEFMDRNYVPVKSTTSF